MVTMNMIVAQRYAKYVNSKQQTRTSRRLLFGLRNSGMNEYRLYGALGSIKIMITKEPATAGMFHGDARTVIS